MSRPALTQEQTDEFRTSVLKCALHLFAKKDYENVSIRAIAKEVNCSPMKLYTYFKSKADIYDAARCLIYNQFAEMQEAIASDEQNPVERLKRLGDGYVKFADEDPSGFRLMFELSRPERPTKSLLDSEKRAFSTLHQTMKEILNVIDHSADAKTLAHMFWTALHGILTLDYAGKLVHGRDRKKLIHSMTSTFIYHK